MIEPGIEAEDHAFIDDNGVSSSDQGTDVGTGEDLGFVHGRI